MNTAADGHERPLVSLVLFAFNQQDYIGEALEGALAQTYEPLEIQVVDDCSPDETFAVIEGIVADYGGPHAVSVHRNQNNIGWTRFGENFNACTERSRGELIVLAAGDDISTPDRVEKLVGAWIEAGRPPAVVMSAFETISDDTVHSGHIRHDGRNYGELPLIELVEQDGAGILGAAIGFTRDLYARFGPIPPESVFEDRVLGFRARLAGKVLYLDEPLVRYRIHADNVSGPSIHADARRWARFCRGHRELFAAFRADVRRLHPDGSGDPQLLEAIDARERHVGRTEKLVSGNPLERAAAAWYVSQRQRNLRYRVSFILKAAGLWRGFDRATSKRPQGGPAK